MRIFPALLGAALAVAGCSDNGGPAAPGGGAPPADALCVDSGCGERRVLLEIPSAENLHFTEDGRLFVSGGVGFYEIVPDGEAFRAIQLSDGSCGFTGIASRGGHLYAVCGNGRVWAAELTATPLLVPIFEMSGMCIANGTTLGPDGHLYVVDEPLGLCVPDPKIVRLRIDPQDPLRISAQEVWVQGSPLGLLFLGLDEVLRFPNGLQSDGRHFYGTDGGSVFSVELQDDGSAGPVVPLFFEVAIHDDLGLVPGGILVTDFGLGRILLLSRDGELLQETQRGLFSFPSSVRLGRPPMFRPGDILVTETGVLTDNNLPLDFLSLFRRGE